MATQSKRLSDLEEASGMDTVKHIVVVYEKPNGVRYLGDVIDMTRPPGKRTLDRAERAKYAAAHGLELEVDY